MLQRNAKLVAEYDANRLLFFVDTSQPHLFALAGDLLQRTLQLFQKNKSVQKLSILVLMGQYNTVRAQDDLQQVLHSMGVRVADWGGILEYCKWAPDTDLPQVLSFLQHGHMDAAV
jgi:hypothetical protein